MCKKIDASYTSILVITGVICDERVREDSRFDLACEGHECLRSTLKGMQMCLGLRQSTRGGTKWSERKVTFYRCTYFFI